MKMLPQLQKYCVFEQAPCRVIQRSPVLLGQTLLLSSTINSGGELLPNARVATIFL